MGRKEDIIRIVERPVAAYEKVFQCKVSVDVAVLDESVSRVESSPMVFPSSEAPEGYDLSSFKMGGMYCFWLRKLKPFSVAASDAESVYSRLFVNEVIAFLVGYYLIYGFQVKKTSPCPKITSRYFNDLITSFRYNSHSPNSTALIFESLCMEK